MTTISATTKETLRLLAAQASADNPRVELPANVLVDLLDAIESRDEQVRARSWEVTKRVVNQIAQILGMTEVDDTGAGPLFEEIGRAAPDLRALAGIAAADLRIDRDSSNSDLWCVFDIKIEGFGDTLAAAYEDYVAKKERGDV